MQKVCICMDEWKPFTQLFHYINEGSMVSHILLVMTTKESNGLNKRNILKIFFKRAPSCPDQCGSVGWASSCKVKDRLFDSWSGHLPGLWVQAPVGCKCEATDRCFSLT